MLPLIGEKYVFNQVLIRQNLSNNNCDKFHGTFRNNQNKLMITIG